MTSLALFCGGPAIYGGLPKPLQSVKAGETLLELFSRTPLFLEADSVSLMVESQFSKEFRALAARLPGDVQLFISGDQSSTLAKLKEFCMASDLGSEAPVVFSYPDIFYFDRLAAERDISPNEIILSSRISTSRFPRFFAQNYVSKVSSIGSPWSASDANRSLIFGGHIISKPSTLLDAIEQIPKSISRPVLEEDGFRSFVNTHSVRHQELMGEWYLADSVRDLARIESHFGTGDPSD